MSTRLAPPWVTYVSKVTALFEKDPAVIVSYDEEENELLLHVDGQDKASALERLFPCEVEFGNVKLAVKVIPSNDITTGAIVRKAFAGNGAVSTIETIEDGVPIMGGRTYVVFKPEVVQFFDDDLQDLNGLHSTLYQDIAREVFKVNGVAFCTDLV